MKEKKAEKHSLRREFLLIFIFLIAGTSLLFWLMNSFFLERYYLSRKARALTGVFTSLSEAARDGRLKSDDFDAELVTFASRDNIEVIVLDTESRTVKAYASDSDVMIRRMWDNLFSAQDDSSETDFFGHPLQESAEDNVNTDTEYTITRRLKSAPELSTQIVRHNTTGLEYMEQWGILPDGSLCLLRTALLSIRNSTAIANRFLVYIALIAIAVGAVVATLLSERIVSPIRDLTRISEKMRQLDFSERYVGEDRSEIAELGQNINELADSLEKNILELKTANIALQRDLEQREKRGELQREFISDVTHELKTPIALIEGYAEGLQEGLADDPESRDEYLSVIRDEADKMNRLVQKLLTLSHLEFGDSAVSMEHFDLAEVIRNYLRSAGILAQQEGIVLRTNIEEDTQIPVWSDPYLTEEVLQNYYTNAVHYARPVGGEKVIDIRAEYKENCVHVSVFNTGDPIPEEALPRIWDKFYKVDKARTREYGGSGIGLSIVKACMEQLHQPYGVINYDNGVSFWFELDCQAGTGTEQTAEENQLGSDH